MLRKLAAVLVRPRATMAAILAAPNQRAVLLLFALAAVSGIFGDFDAPTLQKVVQQSGGAPVGWLIAGITVVVIVLLTALLWFYAWVPFLVGRLLGGTGEIDGVRAALAWGLAPAIWALLYRVPAIWLAPPAADTTVRMRGGGFTFDPGRMANGCGMALVIALLELAVFVWCAFTMSNTVAEAHRFDAGRGFGTLVIAAIAPLVVAVAAFLAMS